MIKNLSFIRSSVLILISWFIIHSLYSVIDGFHDKKEQADVAVIFGNKVNEDGSLSIRLQKRLDCGLEVYNAGRVKKIFVSGGLGKEGYYEGDKMKKYLIEKGIPDTVIIVDNQGNNTLATVRNSLKLKEELRFNEIITVSQYFHLTRIKMLYKKHGFKNISGVCPSYVEIRDLYSIIREFFAFYKYINYKNKKTPAVPEGSDVF